MTNKRKRGRRGALLFLAVLLAVDIALAVKLVMDRTPDEGGNAAQGDSAGSGGTPGGENSGNGSGGDGGAGTGSGNLQGLPDGGTIAEGTGSSGESSTGGGTPEGTAGGGTTPGGDVAGGSFGEGSGSAGTGDGTGGGTEGSQGNTGGTAGGGSTDIPGTNEEGTSADGNTLSETDAALAEEAERLLAGMTLEQKAAQLFIITPQALTDYSRVTAAGEVTRKCFEQYPVGGIIYMANNLVTPDQTRTMLKNMSKYSMELLGFPAFLAVDEEGGTVARVAQNKAFGVENIGNISEIGASGDPSKAYRAGLTIGAYLAEMGFNLDFAPVADVWTNEKNTVVKYRSFGREPLLVRDMVLEELKGLEENGILGAVKHFPGHGSTSEDSHNGAAVVNRTLEELNGCDLIPFQGAIEADVPFVMVGLISLPNVSGSDVPAVLSGEIIGNILRRQLGFEGIVITDALDMGAITDYYTSAEAAVLALEAGADMLLMPENFKEACGGVLAAVREGRLTEQRLDESVLRILKVKLRLPDGNT